MTGRAQAVAVASGLLGYRFAPRPGGRLLSAATVFEIKSRLSAVWTGIGVSDTPAYRKKHGGLALDGSPRAIQGAGRVVSAWKLFANCCREINAEASECSVGTLGR